MLDRFLKKTSISIIVILKHGLKLCLNGIKLPK